MLFRTQAHTWKPIHNIKQSAWQLITNPSIKNWIEVFLTNFISPIRWLYSKNLFGCHQNAPVLYIHVIMCSWLHVADYESESTLILLLKYKAAIRTTSKQLWLTRSSRVEIMSRLRIPTVQQHFKKFNNSIDVNLL